MTRLTKAAQTAGIGSNDQHPDHDSRETERLVKQVYEALRARSVRAADAGVRCVSTDVACVCVCVCSPQYNETVLFITWDEHGVRGAGLATVAPHTADTRPRASTGLL